MSISIKECKKEFPLLNNHKELIYLDNASTTQKPASVIQAITDFYQNNNANIHRGVYKLSMEATKQYDKARESVATLFGAETNEIIFTSGATHGLNLLAHSLPSLFPKEKNDVGFPVM